jgi:hypothetical protein
MTFAVQRPLEGRTGDGASCMKVRRLDPIGLALGMNVVAWTFSMAFGRLPWQRWKRLTVSGTLRGVQAAGRLGLRLLPVTPLQPRLEPHRATPGQDQRQTAQRSPGPQTCVTGRLDQPWATSPPPKRTPARQELKTQARQVCADRTQLYPINARGGSDAASGSHRRQNRGWVREDSDLTNPLIFC